MATPNFLTVEYDNGSSLIIEGFGPNSLSGVVKDILEGHYPPKEEEFDGTQPYVTPPRPDVKSITISKETPSAFR